ncbi:MAG: RNA 2',3'-cyclic phosphodiesterase [Bacteroidales bacterium]|nr:RNA 2',3'-cyclic phosphodiesterase [Bacteroidales bacterium]
MKRTFIAINTQLSDDSLELVDELKTELQDEKIRWVSNNNFHLTLFFIGDTAPNLIPDILKSLRNALCKFDSFLLKCRGLGVFRNYKNPKTLWFGFEPSEQLLRLKKEIDSVMSFLGFDQELAFNPHLTLGRTQFIRDKNNLKSLVDRFSNTPIQTFHVNEVLFIESVLTPQGAIYKPLDAIKLRI